MIVTCVSVFVKKDRIGDFIEATIRNHRESLREEGNLRFDVLQSIADPSRFTLYEAYVSEEAAGAHKRTPHYAEWRDTVAPWMERPRQGVAHSVIAPADPALWKT